MTLSGPVSAHNVANPNDLAEVIYYRGNGVSVEDTRTDGHCVYLARSNGQEVVRSCGNPAFIRGYTPSELQICMTAHGNCRSIEEYVYVH